MTPNETGHVRNAASFREASVICTGFGATYNPPQAELSLSALYTQADENDSLLNLINVAIQAEKDAINLRDAEFKNLSKHTTRIINALAFFDTPANVMENAKSLVAKLNGKRINAVKTNEDGTLAKTISTSQMSYDMRLDNYDKLIKLVAAQANYNPNEQEMKTSTLLAYVQTLRTLNQNVITQNNNISNARITRNKAFYTNANSAYNIVTKVKHYVKYVFGPQSPEYKQIISINFRNVKS
jgi:hypothetical protein